MEWETQEKRAVESQETTHRVFPQPKIGPVNGVPVPAQEQLLDAFSKLGTKASVARFFGVSRRTIDRWTDRLNISPELRPDIPVTQLLSSLLSDLAARVRVAQWIMDEASISVAYNSRYDTSSLMVVGAMNDDSAMKVIAEQLGVKVIPGAAPPLGRLPTHIVKLQGARAYGLLEILSKELTGLKALEASAALRYFTTSGIVKGKLTTDVYMGTVWRQFARQSVEGWNRKRRNKLSPLQISEMVEMWIQNRTARARRGLGQLKPAEVQVVPTSATP